IGPSTALRRSGRFITTTATSPSYSTSTSATTSSSPPRAGVPRVWLQLAPAVPESAAWPTGRGRPTGPLAAGGRLAHWPRGPVGRCWADGARLRGQVSYGWGVVPVVARSGTTTWTTSLFPKDGGYLLPVKVAVQRADGVGLGDLLDVHLLIGEP